jgi:hypothetical protein
MYKKHIKKLYRIHSIYSLQDIISTFTDKQRKNVYLIYKALDTLLYDTKEYIYNVFKQPGKLIYRGIYYIYQPLAWKETILPMYYRNRPLLSKTQKIPLQPIVQENGENMMMNMNKMIHWDSYWNIWMNQQWSNWVQFYIRWKNIRRDEDIPNIDKKRIVEIISDRIPKDQYSFFLQWLFKKQQKYIKSSELKYTIPWNYFIIHFSIFFIEKKERFIGFYNPYENVAYEWNKDTKRWKQLTREIIQDCQINYEKKMKQFMDTYKDMSIIYGFMEDSPKLKERVFKILDKSKEKGAITLSMKRSKRSEVTGRICSTYYIGQLLELFQMLHISYHAIKIKKEEHCYLLEWYLREYEKVRRDGKCWFIPTIPHIFHS